jgi:hypothetical protein
LFENVFTNSIIRVKVLDHPPFGRYLLFMAENRNMGMGENVLI